MLALAKDDFVFFAVFAGDGDGFWLAELDILDVFVLLEFARGEIQAGAAAEHIPKRNDKCDANGYEKRPGCGGHFKHRGRAELYVETLRHFELELFLFTDAFKGQSFF